MPNEHITVVVAFIAGIVSFLAPCVLPIVPGFLAYLAGSSLGEARARRWDVFLNSLFFVFGFSAIFAALGIVLNTLLAEAAYSVQAWLSRIGGIIIIFFGLYLTGLLKIPFLEREHKFKIHTKFKSRYITSFLFGAAFAAGWTPCVGAALGSILGLAATQPGSAFWLLLAYALGLGVPFLIVGMFATPAAALIGRYAGAANYVNLAFGILLIGFGVLVFTQTLSLIANFDFVNKILLHQ